MTSHEQAVRDLTLVLIYLTGWRERDDAMLRCWKTFRFEIVDELAEHGLVASSPRAKSLHLTDEGEQKACELCAKHGIA